MKNFLSHFLRLRKSLLAVLALTMFLSLLPTGVSRAAGLAEEHNILYYLVEMQRRFKKICDGVAMPEAPSLNPSSALRGLAGQSVSSDRSPADFASANGLAGIPLLAVRVQAGSPQEAFDRMNAAQCANLMKPDYHYIGAARSGDQWTVFLAGAEPGSLPAAPDDPGVPAVPGAASGAGTEFVPPAPAQPPATEKNAAAAPSVTRQDAAKVSPPRGAVRDVLDPHPAAPVPTAVAPLDSTGRPVGDPRSIAPSSVQPDAAYQPAAPGAASSAAPNTAPAKASPPRGAVRDAYNPHPAAPVPTAVVPLDSAGRPVGDPQPIEPVFGGQCPPPASGRQYHSAPVPGTVAPAPIYVPRGGAGPVNDPYAPAAPVVTREIMLDSTGKVIGQPPAKTAPSGSGNGVPAPCAPPPASR